MTIKHHEIKRMKTEDLKPADYNPREISDRAKEGLNASMETFGIVDLIVWNKRTGNVVGGHQRLDILLSHSIEETDVIVVDLSLEDEKALNIALNNPHIAGRYTDALQGLLEGILARNNKLFFDLRLEELLNKINPKEEGDPELENEHENTRNICNGDMYNLGEHRLICGSSLDSEIVKKLTNNNTVRVCITDPPYEMKMEEQLRAIIGAGSTSMVILGGGKEIYRLMAVPEIKYRGDFVLYYGGQGRSLQTKYHIIQHSRIFQIEYESDKAEAKEPTILTEEHEEYTNHENGWHLTMGDKSGWDAKEFKKIMGTMGSVIDIDCLDREHHSKEKTVKLWRGLLAGFPNDHEIYEPFLGSGAMLIAGELMKKKIYAIELDPIAVDHAITRWEKFTGEVAVKL